MEINIKEITVLLTDNTDRVSIQTDKPSPFSSWITDYDLKMNFECTHDQGVQYVLDNFGISPKVIDTRI